VLGFDFARLTTARQVHGCQAEYVTESLAGRGRESYADALPETDALYTDCAGLPLMLLFADCTPIILANPTRRLVSVVHAGWRGSVQAILSKTLAQICRQFQALPQDFWAVIGPSVGPCCYEVGEEVYQAAQALPGFPTFMRESDNGKWRFDLQSANKEQLLAAGVPPAQIVVSGLCTACHNGLFFSHRAENGKTGRFAALVCL
jgi:YfiH family protein